MEAPAPRRCVQPWRLQSPRQLRAVLRHHHAQHQRSVTTNRGIRGRGADVPEELLRSLYESVKNEPFKIRRTMAATGHAGQPCPRGWLPKLRRLWGSAGLILTDNCL